MDLERAGPPPIWPLLIAPLLVVGGIALLKVSDVLLYIGPFDRASFGWAVPIPMILVAPAVSGLVARWSRRRPAVWMLAASGAALGLFVIAVLMATIDRIGCNTNPGTQAILAMVAPIGAMVATGYVGAGLVAMRQRDRPVVGMLYGVSTAIAVGFVTLVVFGLEFQAGTCVPVPTG